MLACGCMSSLIIVIGCSTLRPIVQLPPVVVVAAAVVVSDVAVCTKTGLQRWPFGGGGVGERGKTLA